MFLVTGPALRTQAAEPLEAIPDEVAVVLHFSSVDQLVGNVNDMLGAISPLVANAGTEFERGISEMFLHSGRINLEAIDRKAPVYFAIFPLDLAEPAPLAWLVKANDEAALRKALLAADQEVEAQVTQRDDGFEEVRGGPRPYYIARRGEFFLYTYHPEIVGKLAACNPKRSFASVIGPDGIQELHQGDAALAVNLRLLTTKYKSLIEETRDRVLAEIKNLPEDQLQAGGASPEAVRKLYSDLTTFAFDTLFDATWAAGHVDLSAEGGGGSAVVRVTEGSPSANYLAANPGSTLELLELLPAGAPAYWGFHFGPKSLEAWAKWYLQSTFGDIFKDPESAAKIIEQLAASGMHTQVSSFSLPKDAAGGLYGTNLVQAEKPKQLLEAMRGYADAFGHAKTPIFEQQVEYKAAAEKYKDHVIDILSLKYTYPETNKPEIVLAQGIIKKLFGNEGLQTRLALVDDILLEVTGSDPKHMQQTLDSIASGQGVLALEKAYSQTRDKLGEQANVVMLLNVPQLIIDSVNVVRDIEPFGTLLAAAPFNFGLQPPASFSGLSIGAEKNGLRVRVFVPVEQPQNVLKIFMPGA
jgi:hypothetical protein